MIHTWYNKEWFLYFEYIWNQSLTRLKDVSETYSSIYKDDVLQIVDSKLNICYDARKNGHFFHLKRIKHFRSKWKQYDGMHPIMWDMTNVTAYSFSSAQWQFLTFSQYYNE